MHLIDLSAPIEPSPEDLLEPLKVKLWSEDWLQRESGILALGAMAEGAFSLPRI